MTETAPTSAPTPQEWAQAYGRDAARNVATIAGRLDDLAERLRAMAPRLERGDGNASRAAADLVSDFTQGVGALGTFLWSLVRAAGEADAQATTATLASAPAVGLEGRHA